MVDYLQREKETDYFFERYNKVTLMDQLINNVIYYKNIIDIADILIECLPKVLKKYNILVSIENIKTIKEEKLLKTKEGNFNTGKFEFKVILELDFLGQCTQLDCEFKNKKIKKKFTYVDSALLTFGPEAVRKTMTNDFEDVVSQLMKEE